MIHDPLTRIEIIKSLTYFLVFKQDRYKPGEKTTHADGTEWVKPGKGKPMVEVTPGAKGKATGKTPGKSPAKEKKVNPNASIPLPPHMKGKVSFPPDWTDIKINKNPKAEIWATGRNGKGFKAYTYNPEYQAQNKVENFKHIRAIEKHMPEYKASLEAGMKKRIPEAECLYMIMQMGTRPGSRKDTMAKKKAYGATTLQARHVKINGDKVRLAFPGKSGVFQSHAVTDPRIKEILKRRVEGKGSTDLVFDTNEAKILAYSQAASKGGIKSKDLRTRLASNMARQEMLSYEAPENEKDYKDTVKAIATAVSKILGNQPSMALKTYIDPSIWGAWKKKVGIE